MQDLFIEVSLFADESDFGTLTGLLTGLGFEGFWEDGAALKCYINKCAWSPGVLKEIEESVERYASARNIPRPGIVVSSIENRNWNEAWEKTIRPFKIGSRLVVKPSWHPYNSSPDEIVITIDPKMSFGTGYHETTRLVARLMERHLSPGSSVLDIGTGTGILAIAAVKLGATSATGIDTDEWSFRNALENTRLNSVEKEISIFQGILTDLPDARYDLIMANIQRSVIIPMLPEMKRRLLPHGMILLSGLLVEEEEEMVEAFHDHGFRVIEELQQNEWIAFAVFVHTHS